MRKKKLVITVREQWAWELLLPLFDEEELSNLRFNEDRTDKYDLRVTVERILPKGHTHEQ